ncbi:uncharacterized protein LOC135343607 [Halichondria panicea]|uniref:uncharacterized protein LOC135343607 n=1 Tax=Halichondria panicea TaxID=6063 RepID=UPI00312B8338
METNSKLEERFARSLASNDTRTRSRTLKRLTQWVVARSSIEDGFTELEFLKLWKGLYTCMWHSDKPLVQEELVDSLAGLLVMMRRPDAALQYLRTFFTTIAREWHSIDRLRLDKFYLLLRKMLGQSFKLLQNSQWDEEVVQEFISIIKDGPLNHDLGKTTLGVQLHVLEVYVSELLMCSPVEGGVDLLNPPLALLANTRDTTVSGCIVRSVLDVLDTSTLDQLQLTPEAVSDALRAMAINRDTLGRNRKLLYTHCKRFSSDECPPPDSGCGLPQPKRFKRKSKGKIKIKKKIKKKMKKKL